MGQRFIRLSPVAQHRTGFPDSLGLPSLGIAEWTEALLARSKQAPLNVYVGIGSSDDEWLYPLMEKVAEHAERIQELRFYMWSGADKCLGPLRRSCLPRLQALEIRGPPPCVAGNTLFNGEIPSLRRLDLANMTMSNLDTFPLSDLKFLSVQNLHPPRPTMVELLSILGCMHDLVDLYLHDALLGYCPLSNADLNGFRGINLPHLSRLWIRAPLSTIAGFLSCVSTPPKTEVRLRCINENITTPDDYSQLASCTKTPLI